MKAYLHTDIEGVAGWVFYSAREHFYANWDHTQRMNRLLTAEVVAAAKALEEAGYNEIFVNDAHGPGYSIFFEDLPASCKIIHGRGGQAPNWVPMLDASIDCAIAIGQHAMAGTPRANCNHSLWYLTDGDGQQHLLSETTMFAALAAKYDVPLVMVSGDDYLTAEVVEKIPGCATAVVKQSLGLQNTCSVVPSVAHQLIAAAVHDGVSRRKEIAPLRFKGPFKLNVCDRDPAKPALPTALEGHDLFELMHRVCNTAWSNFGNDDAIDDRSFRWPRQPK